MISTTYNRLRHAALATRHEASALVEDARLFARRRNGHCALRQSRVNGMNILVRADEDVGREIYFFREYERRESSFVLRNLHDSDICVDVGANVGFYTLSLASHLPRGTVHAFEPVTLNYHVLAVNVIANRLSNVILNHAAIGDQDGDFEFFVAADGAFSSLFDTGRKPIVEKIRTKMMTLDSYCCLAKLPRIDFLKVDVEGAEQKVVRGARQLLSDVEKRPRLIMLELYEPMLQESASSIKDMISAMHSFGYEPFVCPARDLVPFAEVHHNIFYNVFFTRSVR